MLSVIVMGAATAQTSPTKSEAVFFKTADPQVYRLVVDSPEKDKTSFSIYNERGKKVYYDQIGKYKGFAKTYDFKDFPIGVYTVEVDKGGTILEQELSHFKDRKSYQPFLVDLNQGEGDKVDLTVVGANSRVVEVKIKDNYGNTLFVDEVSGHMGFKRTYDLKKVGNQVAFEVRVDNKIFNRRL